MGRGKETKPLLRRRTSQLGGEVFLIDVGRHHESVDTLSLSFSWQNCALCMSFNACVLPIIKPFRRAPLCGALQHADNKLPGPGVRHPSRHCNKIVPPCDSLEFGLAVCLVRFCYRVGMRTAAAPPPYIDGTLMYILIISAMPSKSHQCLTVCFLCISVSWTTGRS